MRRTGEPAERRHFAVRDNDESGMGAAALKAALHRSELSRGGALALVDSVRTDQRVTASVTASPLLINRNSPASRSNSCLMLQWLNTLMPTPIRSRRLEHQAKTTAAAGSGVPLPAAADQSRSFASSRVTARSYRKLPIEPIKADGPKCSYYRCFRREVARLKLASLSAGRSSEGFGHRVGKSGFAPYRRLLAYRWHLSRRSDSALRRACEFATLLVVSKRMA